MDASDTRSRSRVDHLIHLVAHGKKRPIGRSVALGADMHHAARARPPPPCDVVPRLLRVRIIDPTLPAGGQHALAAGFDHFDM